jgi:hypothetical protein
VKRSDWTVGEFAVRAGGDPDKCAYCQQPVGTQHQAGCNLRHRTIVVKVAVHLVVSVPEDWDADQIEHHFNESFSCKDNWRESFNAMFAAFEADNTCSCSRYQGTEGYDLGVGDTKVLREATETDEAHTHVRVAERQS